MNAPSKPVNAPRQPVNDPMAHAYNVDVEKAVLAVLLDGRHKEAYGVFAELCPDLDAFWVRDHKIIALAVHEFAATGTTPYAQGIAAHLACMPFAEAVEKITPEGERRSPFQSRARLSQDEYDASALAAIGGYNAIADASALFSHVSAMRRNCEQLSRHLAQRRAIAAISEAKRRLEAPDGSTNVELISNDTMQALSGATGKGQQTGGVALGGVEALRRHDQAAARRMAGEAANVGSWGVPALDQAVPLAPGRLIILAALPGCGKTSLLMQASDATRRIHGGQAIRLASWEITSADLANILLCREAKVSRKAVEQGWLTPEQRSAYDQALASWAKDDIQCMFSGPESRLTDIVAWIRLQHRLAAGRLLVVGIDYVQKLPGSKPGMTEYTRVSEISSTLVDLKNQLGICILALCQFSRDTEKNATGKVRQPRASDLRGSGSLEQDADAVVILHPQAAAPGDTIQVEGLVVKNRFGPKMEGENAIRLDFHARAGQVFAPRLSVVPPDDQHDAPSTGPSRGAKMKAEPQDHESEPFDR